MRKQFLMYSLVSIVAGCLFDTGENDTPSLIGKWEYIDRTKLWGSPLYFRTYWEFEDSVSFRYAYVPSVKPTIQYTGHWKLAGDTIKVYPQDCLEVGAGASDSLFPSPCPVSGWGNARLFWDGSQVFDLEGIQEPKRVYRKL